jgi:hypothetical protein
MSYKNSWHTWNLVVAHQCATVHQLRNTAEERNLMQTVCEKEIM